MGGLRGQEKWRLDRTSVPEGWLKGEGFPRLEGPSGAQIKGEWAQCFPCPISWGSLPSSRARSYNLRGPLRLGWSCGHRREDRREQERQAGGALQDRRSKRGSPQPPSYAPRTHMAWRGLWRWGTGLGTQQAHRA